MWRFLLAYAAIATVLFWGATIAMAQQHFQFPAHGTMTPTRPAVVPHPAAPQSTSWMYTWQYSWKDPSPPPTYVNTYVPTYVPYPVYSGYNNPYPYPF